MINKDFLIKLNLIFNVGPASIYGYIKKLRPNFLYDLGLPEDNYSINQNALRIIEEGLSQNELFAKELYLIEKNKIKITTILDEDYPALLKEVHLPPPVIYWKGQSLNYKNCLSVVGSRNADFLAQEAIESLLPAIVEHGFTIVSGGALGVDTMAHKAALKYGGTTIAVLGSGLLDPYPASNKKLFEEIENNGAVVSCFPLEFMPLPENFPARNRVVSGLSRGTLVVQAAAKSGARITAEYALEQGRDVFAVPGPFNHRLSEGCNKLIQEGAKLVFCSQDILSDYGLVTPANSNIMKNKIKKVDSDIDPLLALCISPKGLEDLQFELKMSLNQLQDRLFELQLEGKIKQNFAGLWHRI